MKKRVAIVAGKISEKGETREVRDTDFDDNNQSDRRSTPLLAGWKSDMSAPDTASSKGVTFTL